MSSNRIIGKAGGLLLAAILALGLAHLLLLPPFEGFDETGHYSSILQIADTGDIPRLGTAWMAREVEAYQTQGPMPYSASGLTYKPFFQGDPTPRGMMPSPPFQASGLANWQGQHPPLYYLLLTPLAKATVNLPLRQRLYWLRAMSFLLAFGGLCLAVIQYARQTGNDGWHAALWPLLMPSWFPEMARLGNDSLACLLLALAWGAMLTLRQRLDHGRTWLLLGFWLGLGLLTKAYIWPIALAAFGYLAILAWRGNARLLVWPATAFALMLAIGAPWYLWLAANGIATTNDAAMLAQQGGLLAGLAKHWSWHDFLYSLGSLGKSFIWAGTWSFARPAEIFYLPYLAFCLLLLVGWLRANRQRPAALLPPLVFLLPMLLGLIGQSLLWLALGEKGVTGGWYLHVLVGPLSLILASALAELQQGNSGRILCKTMLAYALAFGAGLAWLQTALYSGCASVMPNSPVYSVDWSCTANGLLLWRRLSMLAEPGLATIAAMLGTSLLAGSLFARRLPSIRLN